MHTRALLIGVLVAGVAGLAMSVMAWLQAAREREIAFQDLDRRASVLTHRLSQTASGVFHLDDGEVSAALSGRVEGYRRLVGFAVFGADGRRVTQGKGVSEFSEALEAPVPSLQSPLHTT